jgi:multicopper oxidase
VKRPLARPGLLLGAALLLALGFLAPTLATGGTQWLGDLFTVAAAGGPRALGARAGLLGEPALPWESHATGNVREFNLTVGRVPLDLEPGSSVQAFAFNGSVPGPELRVTEGDTVRVTVTNTLDEPTTVHWHGVELPLPMDGVAGFSQDPIAPGASFTYDFVAYPAGTRWYHSHFRELLQHGAGLYGALIVEPREPLAQAAPDREYTLFSGEWVTGVRPTPAPADHQRMSHGGAEDVIAGRPQFKSFAINGRTYAGSTPLLVRQGERVRLRLVNAGVTETQTIALAGHRLTITHSDGNPLAQPIETEALRLGVGERADVEFLADTPGRWQLRSLSPGHLERGLAVDVVYEGHETVPVQGFAPDANPAIASYAEMLGPQHLESPSRVYDVTLSGNYDSGESWTINGKRYPETDPLELFRGERVRLRLYNASGEDHPMHLHGHAFQVVVANGQPVDGPLKDTLTLRPEERYEVEFVGVNPNVWLFHCHNIVHMGAGMTTEVRYR